MSNAPPLADGLYLVTNGNVTRLDDDEQPIEMNRRQAVMTIALLTLVMQDLEDLLDKDK